MPSDETPEEPVVEAVEGEEIFLADDKDPDPEDPNYYPTEDDPIGGGPMRTHKGP